MPFVEKKIFQCEKKRGLLSNFILAHFQSGSYRLEFKQQNLESGLKKISLNN